MDLIAKAALPDAWLEDLGARRILLKGRGGVGKTVILLQMAYRAYDRSGQRSLILTFNKALVADMPLAGPARVSFLIYKRVSGVWVFRTSATLPVNSSGVATFSWAWGRGEWYVRARANTTPYNAARLSTIARVIAR